MTVNIQINRVWGIGEGSTSLGEIKDVQVSLENANNLEKKSNSMPEEIVAVKNESIGEGDKEKQQLKDAMSTISEFLNIPVRSVNFAKHEETSRTVIKIFDSENKELIKQIPSEEVLSIAQRIVKLQQDVGSKTGILLDENI
jgi:flagellar protein FlaG